MSSASCFIRFCYCQLGAFDIHLTIKTQHESLPLSWGNYDDGEMFSSHSMWSGKELTRFYAFSYPIHDRKFHFRFYGPLNFFSKFIEIIFGWHQNNLSKDQKVIYSGRRWKLIKTWNFSHIKLWQHFRTISIFNTITVIINPSIAFPTQ